MRTCISLATCTGLIVVIGCSQQSPTTTGRSTSNLASAVDGSKYLLVSEPDDEMGVIKVRKEAKDKDTHVNSLLVALRYTCTQLVRKADPDEQDALADIVNAHFSQMIGDIKVEN